MRAPRLGWFPVPVFLLLAGCSEAPKPPAEAPKPVSAQTAFYRVFGSARGWAADAQPLRVAEIDVDEVKAEGGKAGAWEAVFVSQSQGQVRRYVYSVIHRPARNLREGVNAEPPEAWSGRGDSEPFLFQAFKTDSPAAYEVAMMRSGDYAKKNPGKEVKFLLEKTRRFANPRWQVFWGESISASNYSIFVDAATGEYLGTGR
ncbi:MAG: hypothetical protein ACLQGV_13745 [Bryobacteraceae bacterium]